MQVVPFSLPERSSVLVVGAGGGFDFVCGLPIVLEFEARGHQVHIGNYSFTNLRGVTNVTVHSKHLLEVTADSTGEDEYFPERLLARWYREERGQRRSVWCLDRSAVPQTLLSYRYLVERLKIDAVVAWMAVLTAFFAVMKLTLEPRRWTPFQSSQRASQARAGVSMPASVLVQRVRKARCVMRRPLREWPNLFRPMHIWVLERSFAIPRAAAIF